MYICSNCGYTTITKLWRCPECGQFGTFVQEKKEKWKNDSGVVLQENKNNENKFYDLKNEELKRVFTNWIKSSGVYLLWGHPWVGKSTIVLQILESLQSNINIAYFSGEEESSAVYNRYKRLFDKNPNFSIFHSTSLEDILSTIEEKNIDLFILDSVQTIYSDQTTGVAGSVNQVKYCSEKLSEFCKKNNVASIIIGHITKSWEIAWPKYLEHIVDVVAYLEWDRFGEYRFLRTYKNRFWGTDDVAIFQMTSKGLIPAYNMKDELKKDLQSIPWTLLGVWIDNGRAVLTTIEVLVNKTKYKFPKRSAIWVDSGRLEMIIAVLERYMWVNLWFVDIFVNIPWEFKFFDSWLDLAIAMGILSAYENKIIDTNNVFIWEISLSGKINKTKFHKKRENEAKDFNVVDFNSVKNIRELRNFI